MCLAKSENWPPEEAGPVPAPGGKELYWGPVAGDSMPPVTASTLSGRGALVTSAMTAPAILCTTQPCAWLSSQPKDVGLGLSACSSEARQKHSGESLSEDHSPDHTGSGASLESSAKAGLGV